jgi:hypothetical protein
MNCWCMREWPPILEREKREQTRDLTFKVQRYSVVLVTCSGGIHKVSSGHV